MNTNEKILHEARGLYAAHGLAGLSMRKVAERVGISATAIYRHYEDKDALLLRMVEHGFEHFGGYLLSGLEGKTPLERLRQTARGYFDFAIHHPRDYSLIFMSGAQLWGLEVIPERAEAKFRATYQMLIDRIDECMDAGDLAGDREVAGLLVWADCHGLASLWINNLNTHMELSVFRNVVERSLDHIQRGLRG